MCLALYRYRKIGCARTLFGAMHIALLQCAFGSALLQSYLASHKPQPWSKPHNVPHIVTGCPTCKILYLEVNAEYTSVLVWTQWVKQQFLKWNSCFTYRYSFQVFIYWSIRVSPGYEFDLNGRFYNKWHWNCCGTKRKGQLPWKKFSVRTKKVIRNVLE